MARVETAKLEISDRLVFSNQSLNIFSIFGAGGQNDNS